LNAIQDWLDHRDDDAVTGISGAESDYYLSSDQPYTCANGPFTHISELFLVKGMSLELFEANPDEEDAQTIIPHEVITVHGLDEKDSGKGYYTFSTRVNINTAPEQVIAALLPRNKTDLAKDLVSYRVEQTEDDDFINPLDKGWTDQVIFLSTEEKANFDRLIRYDSNLFRVNAKAKVNLTKITLHALIQRTKDKLTGKWSCRIVQVTKED